MTSLKFFYNGIKGTDKKLQKVFYSNGPFKNLPTGTITIYAREYCRFTKEIRDIFTVKNDTDIMTDYFENDRIRVFPCHPLYNDVLEALNKAQARRAA
jgi:hypothetical protein